MIPTLIVIAYILVFLEFLILTGAFRFGRRERKRSACRADYAPRAAILSPHYGWDEQTERNARFLLAQDYPGDWEVVFITHKRDGDTPDPSYEPLRALAAEHGRARVLLASNIVDQKLGRSQKVENLLTAVRRLDPEIEVLAFVDADSRVRPDWLVNLVQPLQEDRVGATVGARYYVPHTRNLATLVESVWINIQLLWQGDHPRGMVWGGSNAMRRELFERADVAGRWENAPFEDHHLTNAVRDLGRIVHFAPEVIVVTEMFERSWAQVLEFTNRQIIVTYRMGLKTPWAMILLMYLPKALIVMGLGAVYWNHPPYLIAIAGIPVIDFTMCFVSFWILPRWLRREPKVLGSHILASLLCPLSMLVAIINALNALFRSEIVWGGVRYVIPSATECRVVGRETK